MTFKGAADEVAGAKTHGQRQRENDTAEENTKGQLHDATADAEMVERHGAGKYEHQPLDPEGEKTRVLDVGVYSSNENGALQVARHEGAGD